MLRLKPVYLHGRLDPQSKDMNYLASYLSTTAPLTWAFLSIVVYLAFYWLSRDKTKELLHIPGGIHYFNTCDLFFLSLIHI